MSDTPPSRLALARALSRLEQTPNPSVDFIKGSAEEDIVHSYTRDAKSHTYPENSPELFS